MTTTEYIINKHEIQILKDIYNKIYLNLPNSHVDIFLCGGDLNSNTTRKKVRNLLKYNKELMIFFPERIFVEYFNLNKSADYLSLETILAENVDYICIVCESPGAFAELGAFANNKRLQNKIIVLNDERYKEDPSFINLGPLKHLKKINKKSVLFYNNENITVICLKLIKFFRKHLKTTTNPRGVETITGMFYFIALLLFLFKFLDKKTLNVYIKYTLSFIAPIPENFNFEATYSAVIKILYNESFIKNKDRTSIELTKTGKDFIYKLLHKDPKSIYNDVISDIIWYKFYHYSSQI